MFTSTLHTVQYNSKLFSREMRCMIILCCVLKYKLHDFVMFIFLCNQFFFFNK